MSHSRFLLNAEQDDTQWLVVFDEPPKGFMTRVPNVRRILFITEPPEVKPYLGSYLRQFGIIISPFAMKNVPKGTLWQENPCLNWHYGIETADTPPTSHINSLAAWRDMTIPLKSKRLSVICSTKVYTEAQRKRIAFVEKLQKRFGNAVDIYGHGRNPISDKKTAIAPYKYHLVLENNYINNFWTEKLSDTYLGYAYPCYLGAPNLPACCPQGALLPLTPDADDANLDAIDRLLEVDPWETALPAIQRCRQWVLETTNVFARVDRLIQQAPASLTAQALLDKPVQIVQANRWHRALLRRAVCFGLYNPFAP